MASSLINVCRFNPTAGGTTDWTYSSAVQGYQSPSAAGAVNGATYSYRAESTDLSQWEVGTGVYNSGTGVLTRAAVLFNSSGTTSKIDFSATPQVAVVALAEDIARPVHTRTVITTAGAGTYNTPTGCKAILVKLQGAGGGGGGSGATPGTGGNGTSTTFNAGAITAPGGTGSTGGSGSGSAGGAAGSGGDFSIPGGRGKNSNNSIALGDSGDGGNGYFGGAGTGAMPNAALAATAAAANSGAGGGGGGSASGIGAVGGGGAGAYTEKLISGPASSYSYVVGTKGAAGTAGTGGSAGSAGADGIIIVEEFY